MDNAALKTKLKATLSSKKKKDAVLGHQVNGNGWNLTDRMAVWMTRRLFLFMFLFRLCSLAEDFTRVSYGRVSPLGG